MQHPTPNFWPSARQFAEAVQCPSVCFNMPSLKGMTPAIDRLGMPLVTSGQFAYVFKLNSDDGESLAVRCFRGFLGDREERYRALDAHFNLHRVAALPQFKYLPRGVLVAGRRFPVLVMEWVSGPTLDVYLDGVVGRREVLLHLAGEWLKLMEGLRAAGVAHGDLQHGNVIVERGAALRLVDLDGMYVPALHGLRSSEVGHQHYQHPARDAHFFAPEADNFSALVVYLSLISLAERPSLWAEHHDENLIFTRADFAAPDSSALFAKVSEIGEVHARLAGALADAARSADPAAAPWLLDLAEVKSRLPSWMAAPAEAVEVGERTREVARAEVTPAAAAAGADVWARPREQRRPPTSLSSNTVQTIFSTPTATAAPSAHAPLDPSKVRANTLEYAKRVVGDTYGYLWWIPVHNIVLEEVWRSWFAVTGLLSTLYTLVFCCAVFLLYGLLRAVYEKAVAGPPTTQRPGLAASPPSQLPPSPPPAPGTPGGPQPLFSAGGNLTTTTAAAAVAGPVVGNRGVSIYHLPACVWAGKIARPHRADFDSPAAAQRAGYRPCHVCAP
jgi:Metal binding domain of Ada